MKLFGLLFFLSAILLPLQVFSQNPIYIADGNIFVNYPNPLFASQNKNISFNITGESFFSATSTTQGSSSFITNVIRSPQSLGNVTISEPAGPSQRGDAFLNGGGIVNAYFSSQNAAENTNFTFNVQFAVPKLTPKETVKFIDVPFTMRGRVICFNSNTNPQPSFFNYQIYGSGIAHLRFDRVGDFSGRHLRKVYLAYVDYEFLNQPFPQ